MTTTAVYVDPAALDGLSRAAVAEADVASDPLAVVAATRARRVCPIEPRHAAERLGSAARMGDAGRALRRPMVAHWEPIWLFALMWGGAGR